MTQILEGAASAAASTAITLLKEQIKAQVIGDGTNQTGQELVFSESWEFNHGTPHTREQVFPINTEAALLVAEGFLHLVGAHDGVPGDGTNNQAQITEHFDIAKKFLGIQLSEEESGTLTACIRPVANAAAAG